jgi:hypothetical protein
MAEIRIRLSNAFIPLAWAVVAKKYSVICWEWLWANQVQKKPPSDCLFIFSKPSVYSFKIGRYF